MRRSSRLFQCGSGCLPKTKQARGPRWRPKGTDAQKFPPREIYHLIADAADFGVRGKKRAVLAYLQNNPSVGGLKLYGGDGTSTSTGGRAALGEVQRLCRADDARADEPTRRAPSAAGTAVAPAPTGLSARRHQRGSCP